MSMDRDRALLRHFLGAVFYMKEPVRLNYLWAGLCLCGAVFFLFRR